MPFEKSSVSPVVADLLKVRAYIADRGFTRYLCGPGRCGCFLGTAEWLGIRGDVSMPAFLQPVADELRRRFGPPTPLEVGQSSGKYGYDAAFTVDYLYRHKVTAPVALEIIDAAIARVSA